MTKHTPGPWGLRASARTIEVYPINELGIRPTIAKIEKMPREAVNESQANARLIAAAPDMLEALRLVENQDLMLPSDREIIKAAIALATGSLL